uniref:uncharacterized protein LOC101294291 isoform X1 n=1 Tax=Fragaria vesca subsp. vesca TaxID=101020 RepID=UPI0005C95278|nr:PREDICTED: uncharacterized protein LOC101294291 isoform X1 [Fragaria vesca subsp. vesca]
MQLPLGSRSACIKAMNRERNISNTKTGKRDFQIPRAISGNLRSLLAENSFQLATKSHPMASKVVCLSQDQNLNVHSDGVSVAGKPALKSTKKGGVGGRKPLADLSNRGKPDFTKATKKPALNNFPKIIADASKKKGSSETLLQKTSNVVSEESSCEYEKEGFLHDHEQCMKTMREATQLDAMDIYWMLNGPTPCKKLASPPKPSELTKFEQDSLIMYLKEIPEDQYILLPTAKYSVSSPPLSPPPSPDWYTNLRIGVDCDIQVMGSP